MHDKIPDVSDNQAVYQVAVVGKGMKRNRWHGYVIASSPGEAGDIIEEGYPDISLGVQGISSVSHRGVVPTGDVLARIKGVTHPNAIVFRDGDGEIVRVHRGMLDG